MYTRWLLFLWCFSLLSVRPANAGDGRLIWKTIQTAHFRVHYPAHLESLADRTAVLCEEAYSLLTPIFEHKPTAIVDVNLTDFGDSANGSATAFPMPSMNLYAAPPRLDSNLGDQSDWLRLLIYHEFTHILQLDQVSGLPRLINAILGRIIAANHNLPSFQLEGGATWAESITSGFGRIHSAQFRGYLRAQALAGKLHKLDAMTHVPLNFPGANVWYLYGGHFTHWLVNRVGVTWLAQLHRNMGRKFFGFDINRETRRIAGRTLESYYDEWMQSLKAQSIREATAVRQKGETSITAITQSGQSHKNVRFLKDGTLLSIDSVREETAIYARSPIGKGFGPPHPFLMEENISEFDVCPNDDLIIYGRSMKIRGTYRYNDLYVYNRRQKSVRRLTQGARIREPYCGPDSRRIIGAQVAHGGTRLVEVRISDGATRVLYTPEKTGVIAFPSYHADGRHIVFTQVGPTFGRDLVRLDAHTGQTLRLTHDDALELHPRFTRDGSAIIFASDVDQIFNLYSADWKTNSIRQLSRVVNGIIEGVRDPKNNRLAVATITADGFDLGLIENKPLPPQRALGQHKTSPTLAVITPKLTRRDYEPGDRLWPVRWSPSVSVSTAADAANQLGLEVDGFDPLNHHSISGIISTKPEEQEVDGSLRYGFRRYLVKLSASVSRRTLEQANAIVFNSEKQGQRARARAATLGMSLPLALGGWSASSSLSYSLSHRAPIANVEPNHDPLDLPPTQAETTRSSSIALNVQLGSLESYFDSISTEKGWSLSGAIRLRRPELGSEDEAVEFNYYGRAYLALWARHVLALRFDGAIGRGANGRRAFYSLGPPPERNVLLDAFDEISFGTTFMRGYPGGTVSGDRFLLLSAEYRLPLWDIFSGFSTAPLFLRRFKLAVFTDWAQAGYRRFSWDDERIFRSVGTELVSQATIMWRLAFNVRLGYARGFKSAGENQVYFVLGRWF